jgi:SHS2 domain-containing protein
MKKPESEFPFFEMLEHTADAGLMIYGKTLEELFGEAAKGLNALCLLALPETQTQKQSFSLAAQSLEELLIAFLSHLVLLLYSRHLAASQVNISFPQPLELVCEAQMVIVQPQDIKAEVKSPTYHRLLIENSPEGWKARVYFDL